MKLRTMQLLITLFFAHVLCAPCSRRHCLRWTVNRGRIIARGGLRSPRKLNGGVAVLFAATESEGPNAIYGFRQDNDFFYLTGWAEPGGAVVIAPAVEAKGDAPARPYTEILFLPPHNPDAGKMDGAKAGGRRSECGRRSQALIAWRAWIRCAICCVQIVPQPRR